MRIIDNVTVSRSGFKTGRIVLSNDDSMNRNYVPAFVTIDYDNAPANFPNKGELEWLMERITSSEENSVYFPIGVKIELKPYDYGERGVWVLADYINYLLRWKE